MIIPGVNNKMLAIKAPTLTFLAGSPAAGLVLWQSLTFPPKTVAQEVKLATNTIAVSFKMLFFVFFVFCFSTLMAFRIRLVFFSGL
jgi:hypothetical protein